MARSLSREHAQCSHFRSMAEVSFFPSANTRKRASASREVWGLFAVGDHFAVLYSAMNQDVSETCIPPINAESLGVENFLL